MTLQVGVSVNVVSGQRIQAAILREAYTVLRTTLPVPEILVRVEQSEADKVGTTEALVIELTGTLVENLVQVILCLSCGVCTVAKSVDVAVVLPPLRRASASAAMR